METVPLENQTEPQTPEQEKTDWKHFLLDLLETVGLAVVLFLIINALSARVRVDGFSMLPTLHDGEFVLVNKLAYHIGSPTRGDIIVFQSTTEKDLDLIKRVIGLPGDHIVIENNKVMVNGQTLNEPYIAAAPLYFGEWTVPVGDLFVLGDNRNDSSDSHVWGFLPIQNVVGKSLLIYWPPPEWAMVDHVKIEVPAP
ncbi:MAG: signal peptidase I [Anaerolineales bacterium]